MVYVLLLSIPFALLAAMFVLARRAETAAYTQIEGQPGAAFAALGTIRRGWTFTQEPVAVDPRTQDLVFRGVGPPGRRPRRRGPRAPHRASCWSRSASAPPASSPVRPITLIQVGDGEGQVALRKLPRAVQKLRPKLSKQEVAEVSKRLTALGGVRLPVPKGVDPMRARPDRKGMRGR